MFRSCIAENCMRQRKQRHLILLSAILSSKRPHANGPAYLLLSYPPYLKPPKYKSPLYTSQSYSTMSAERALYLRMLFSAFTAESRALNSAGGCHIRRIWYNGCEAGIIPAPSRWRPKGAKTLLRRVRIPRRDGISKGDGIMTAKAGDEICLVPYQDMIHINERVI